MLEKLLNSKCTLMKYQAGIYFDNNDVVLTNVTKNTLYDSPEPDAAFSYKHACADTGKVYDFEYTGNTPDDASYSWAFADGTPSTSTSENPTNITFSSSGYKLVNLAVNRNGCTASVSDTILIKSVLVGTDSVRICQSGDSEFIIDLDSLDSYLEDDACVGECDFLPARLAQMHQPLIPFAVKISPNPVLNYSFIQIAGAAIEREILSIEILNYTGNILQKLYEGKALNNSQLLHEKKYDLSALASGLYFIRVRYGTEQKVVKIIIQK